MRPSTHISDSNVKTNWRVLFTLFPYLMEYKFRVLVALTLLICAKLSSVALPWILKLIVDDLDTSGTAVITVPMLFLLVYGVFRFFMVFLGEMRDAVFARVTERAVRRVSLKIFSHLHKLDLDFHLSRKTGGLARDIERGTSGIGFLLRFLLFNIFPILFELVLISIILFNQFSLQFSVVVVGAVLVYVSFSIVVTEWRTKYVREANETNSRSNTRSVDSLLNYETVKYFNNEEFEAKEYDQYLKDWEQSRLNSRLSLSALNSGQAFIISASVTLMMIMAAQGVADGDMTLGDFVMINAYMIQLFIPLNFLGFVYREIRQALINIEKMFSLFEQNPKVFDAADAVAFNPKDKDAISIEFDHVSFAYDPERPILKDISFRVAPGEKVAIVGPSGAGKSTIAKLLFRFYDPEAGVVRMNGKDMTAYTLDSVRKQFGVVPQDTVLFNDTIYYNIAYAKPLADKSEIDEVTQRAHLSEFVESLPKDYETLVGERGLKVSGGEKQRLAIARVLLKNPPILIFDEATSSLDTHAERVISSALDDLAQKHTAVVIAHRLSTIMNADNILVLSEGRIVEEGKHEGLIEKNGHYAKLWRNQNELSSIKNEDEK